MSIPFYVVIVGNIGTVCEDSSKATAMRFFREYRDQSRSGVGRAAGEPVTVMLGDAIVEEYTPPRGKLPTIADLAALVRAVKADISPEYRAFEDDDTPGIQLTVGWEEDGDWSYQTGDNSFTGGAYAYPHWAVVGVYPGCNSRDVARDIRAQLADCLY